MENRQLTLFDNFNLPVFSIIFNVFPNVESDELEYKSAEGGFPKDFWKTYSSFSNSKGGIIILGIKEQKGSFTIEGLTDDKIVKYQKEFWSGANNKNTISLNLLSDSDVKEFEVEGKKVLAFKIPQATRTQRPVFLTRNPFGNTYKRNYEGDYSCPDEEVRRMLADADLNFRPDSRILEGYSIEDFDIQSIRQYRQLFASNHTNHPWLSFDDKELLAHLGAYRKDRKSKVEGPTLAGILMFGKTLSITDVECCPNFFPDYREILTSDPQIRWTDRIYPDGNWEGNLFQFYRKVWPKLASSLPKPFQLKDGVRQDETPAHTALREAFVNALIHTDYSAPSNIIIELKTDIIRFINPGTLLVSIAQYYEGGISECRNTSIQKMFLMIGSAEKAGSGVNKIMSGWGDNHWRSPYVTIETQPDRIILELPMFSILPDETLQALRNLFGERVDALSKDELTILATCHIEGEITNSRLQYMIDRHRTDITKILQELCKDGFLLSENKSRWTTYHLNTNLSYEEKSDLEDNTAKSDANVDTSSNASVDTMDANVDTMDANVDTSDPNVDTSSDANVDTPIVQPKKTRLQKKELEQAIVELCKFDFKSLDEIGRSINKAPKYLKNNIIPPMIESGKLVRLHPKINHPNQAYKAVTN